MITLEFGKKHAQENGATHHRKGDIFKVTNKVQCWEFGEWVNCENHLDVSDWLKELTEIDWEKF